MKNNKLKLKQKVLEREEKTKEEELKKNLENERKQNELKSFHEYIDNIPDMESNLNDICEKIKYFTNSVGVYIASYDKRLLEITEASDETSHRGEKDVLRYIYYNNDHEFLKNKVLEAETGVSYDLLKEEEEVAAANPNMDPDQPEEKKEFRPKNIFIPEVVREKRMFFFREPKLGSWLGVNLTYDSYLNREVNKLVKFNN